MYKCKRNQNKNPAYKNQWMTYFDSRDFDLRSFCAYTEPVLAFLSIYLNILIVKPCFRQEFGYPGREKKRYSLVRKKIYKSICSYKKHLNLEQR